MAEPAPVEHPTILAERMRARAQPVTTIARRLGISICVVQRWFDLIDELSTDGDSPPDPTPVSYKNVQP